MHTPSTEVHPQGRDLTCPLPIYFSSFFLGLSFIKLKPTNSYVLSGAFDLSIYNRSLMVQTVSRLPSFREGASSNLSELLTKLFFFSLPILYSIYYIVYNIYVCLRLSPFFACFHFPLWKVVFLFKTLQKCSMSFSLVVQCRSRTEGIVPHHPLRLFNTYQSVSKPRRLLFGNTIVGTTEAFPRM